MINDQDGFVPSNLQDIPCDECGYQAFFQDVVEEDGEQFERWGCQCGNIHRLEPFIGDNGVECS